MAKKRKPGSESSIVKIPEYGNPEYASGEDIYSQEKKLSLDEEGNVLDENEAKPENDLAGEDLDIPGAELDDDDEKIGEEDEENNYYSLGGDDHDDLEENKS